MTSISQSIPVLHLNWRFDIGGAETHIVELCQQQKRLGFYPVIICQDLRNRAYLSIFKRAHIPFYERNSVHAIKKIIKKYKIQLIHAHSSTTYPLATKIAHETGLPLIGTLHGPGAVQKLDNIPLNASIAISNEVYSLIRSKNPYLNTSIINNGIDTKKYRAIKKSRIPKIAYVGRVDATKIDGVRALHLAIKEIEEKLSFISLSTLKKHKLNNLIGTLIQGEIDSSKVLKRTDIVIGTGRAIMEGMSAGNVGIVLGQYYDGIVTPANVNQLLPYNFSGRFSRKKATVEELQKDIESLIRNRERLVELQQWSREYAQHHLQVRERAQRHKELYLQLLQKERSI